MGKSRTVEDRGILQMAAKASWLPTDNDSVPFYTSSNPFVRFLSDMNLGTHLNTTTVSTRSLVWSTDNGVITTNTDAMMAAGISSPDLSLASLFTQSLAITSGSAATALSTLIFILSKIAYYNQMPYFETLAESQEVAFQTVLYPQSQRGFWAVLVVVSVQWMLVIAVTTSFMKSKRHTTLGNHWQAVSQVMSAETEMLIKDSTRATDREVREVLKAQGRGRVKVRVAPVGDGDRVGLVSLRPTRIQRGIGDVVLRRWPRTRSEGMERLTEGS